MRYKIMIPMFFDNDVRVSGLYRKRISMVDKSVYQSKNNQEIIERHISHISEDLQEEGYQLKEATGYIKGKLVICEITYLEAVH